MIINNIYDVIILTNRNYGLYAAFSCGILGLKVLIIQKINTNDKKKIITEDKIWINESEEDYLVSIQKININILKVEEFFYQEGEIIKINIIPFLKDNKIFQYNTKYIIKALSEDIYITKKSLESINEYNNIYMIGEKINYPNKIFKQDIYTGEANFISQDIYQKIHNIQEGITIHSTDL